MLWLPKTYQRTHESNLSATPSGTTLGTTVTASATPHTKGSYAQILASTAFDVFGFWVDINNTTASNTNTSSLLDISIGAAASEQVIVSNLLCGWRAGSTTAQPQGHYFPIFIPKGTRVAARCQSAVVSKQINTAFFFFEGDSRFGAGSFFVGCDAYGTDTATSTGTAHTAGNTGTESAFASIGTTLSRNYGAVSLVPQGKTSDTAMTAGIYHYELGIGDAQLGGYEIRMIANGAEYTMFSHSFPLYANLPSGTQLQVRGECSGTAESIDLAAYCFF